jgi:hypothetical protein
MKDDKTFLSKIHCKLAGNELTFKKGYGIILECLKSF